MSILRFLGIFVGLILVEKGYIGFVYIIRIGGVGPEISWGCAAGPFILGILIIVGMMAIKSPKNKLPDYLM